MSLNSIIHGFEAASDTPEGKPRPAVTSEEMRKAAEARRPLTACPVSGSISCEISSEKPVRGFDVPAGLVTVIGKPKPVVLSSKIAPRSFSAIANDRF